MPVLTTKVRRLLEKVVADGVPPVAAGMTLGYTAKTVQSWVQLGMATLDDPPKVEKPDLNEDYGPALGWMTGKEYLAHVNECRELARAVAQAEGKLVGALVKRMFKNSGKNPDMMKFLFRTYTGAHGKEDVDRPGGRGKEEAGVAAKGSDDAVVIIKLPDNGRELTK